MLMLGLVSSISLILITLTAEVHYTQALMFALLIMYVCISIEISHWFSAKENDWGYVSFFPWKVILIIIIIIIVLMS